MGHWEPLTKQRLSHCFFLSGVISSYSVHALPFFSYSSHSFFSLVSSKLPILPPLALYIPSSSSSPYSYPFATEIIQVETKMKTDYNHLPLLLHTFSRFKKRGRQMQLSAHNEILFTLFSYNTLTGLSLQATIILSYQDHRV